MASVWADADEQPTGADKRGHTGPSRSLTALDEDDLEDEQEPTQLTVPITTMAWGVRQSFQAARAALEETGANDENSSEDLGSLPRILRDRFPGGLRTAGDAYEAVEMLMTEQLQRASIKQPPPNEPIQGDAVARTAFQLLLTLDQQRMLFMDVASSASAWPRMRALIGAPPHNFLRSEDAGVLNASGFARGRTNMVYEQDSRRIPNYSQFGPGQLVDEYLREYRVAPHTTLPSDPLPSSTYFHRSSTGHILHVKVKRQSVHKKRELLRSEQRKQLFFPQPGEMIVLQETQPLVAVSGIKGARSLNLRVKALWPRSNGSSTAALLVSI